MMTTTQISVSNQPHSLEEFMNWEATDGFKYEWNDGEIVKFEGITKKHLYIFANLNNHFFCLGLTNGFFITNQTIEFNNTHALGVDIAYFTDEQIQDGRNGVDVIPAFVIEVISETDQMYKIEDKIIEYFKAGVQILWLIIPEQEVVYVYTSRKDIKVCTDDDICSAYPVLPEFKISVNQIFALPNQ